MSYATVLFDLDHTLLDSDASLNGAYESTMRSVGINEPAALYADFDRINQALWRRVERHELSPNDVRVLRFQQLVDELGIEGDPEAMASSFVDGLVEHGELYAGAREMLDDLAGRVRMGMITNGIGKVQRGRLERLDLARYFEIVTISGEVGANKPGAEIFDITFDAMNLTDRSTAVMIGDNLASDIEGGKNAGIATIWFNQYATSSSDVVPTHEVGTLAEISELI